MKLSKKNILLLYIITYPIWDVVYSLTSVYFTGAVNLNQIIRMLGVLFILTFIRNISSYIIIFGTASWGLICLWLNYSRGVSVSIMTDVTWLIKLISGLIIFLAFKELFSKEKLEAEEVLETLRKSLYLPIISILLSYVGIGFDSYGSGRAGVKGLFTAQNTLTEYMVILYSLQYCMLRGKKRIAMICITAFATISIGTKLGYIGIGIELLAIAYINAFSKKNGKVTTTGAKLSGLGIMAVGAIGVGAVLMGWLLDAWNSLTYNTTFYGYLVSNRDWQIKAAKAYFIKDKWNYICGIGYSRGREVIQSYHKAFNAIEQDFHAIYFYFGAIIFVLFTTIIVVIAYKAVVLLLKNNSKIESCMAVAFIVAIISAYLGGHVILEAMTQLPFWIIAAYLSYRWNFLKKGKRVRIRLF